MKRLELLQQLREIHKVLPDKIKSCLSPAEIKFYGGYSALVNACNQAYGHNIFQRQRPPNSAFVEVDVLRDAGVHSFLTYDQHMVKGQTCQVPADQVENLRLQRIITP